MADNVTMSTPEGTTKMQLFDEKTNTLYEENVALLDYEMGKKDIHFARALLQIIKKKQTGIDDDPHLLLPLTLKDDSNILYQLQVSADVYYTAFYDAVLCRSLLEVAKQNCNVSANILHDDASSANKETSNEVAAKADCATSSCSYSNSSSDLHKISDRMSVKTDNCTPVKEPAAKKMRKHIAKTPKVNKNCNLNTSHAKDFCKNAESSIFVHEYFQKGFDKIEPESIPEEEDNIIMNQGSKWNNAQCKLLIELFNQYKYLKKNGINVMYSKISDGMKAKGHEKDHKQCRSKMDNMLKHYKDSVDHNNTTGNDPHYCEFYEELEEIEQDKPIYNPIALAGANNPLDINRVPSASTSKKENIMKEAVEIMKENSKKRETFRSELLESKSNYQKEKMGLFREWIDIERNKSSNK